MDKAWLVCSPSTRELARCRPPENRLECTGDEQLNESPAGSGWGTCAWLHSSGFHPACRPTSTSLIIRWGDKSSNPSGTALISPGACQVRSKDTGKQFPVASTSLSMWSHLSQTGPVTDTKYGYVLPPYVGMITQITANSHRAYTEPQALCSQGRNYHLNFTDKGIGL